MILLQNIENSVSDRQKSSTPHEKNNTNFIPSKITKNMNVNRKKILIRTHRIYPNLFRYTEKLLDIYLNFSIYRNIMILMNIIRSVYFEKIKPFIDTPVVKVVTVK